MDSDLTIIGGGLGGLIAAITAAEAGAAVELHEAHAGLGGRARTSGGPFLANLGPHALYADGPLWRWLAERDLLAPVARPLAHGFRFRWRSSLRRVPPAALVRALPLVWGADAPVEQAFTPWASAKVGPTGAAALAAAAGVATFTADPGALSAAFVQGRLQRALRVPPSARFVIGGWARLIETLEARAAAMGVRIARSSPVERVPEHQPVVVALELDAARRLLGDDSLRWPSGRVALVDLGLRAQRGDPYIVSDLDEGGWVERFSAQDPTLAPDGHSLLQVQLGTLAGEPLERAVARAEALVDAGYPEWREREVWRRRSILDGRTGALDPPGTTWRDRPAIDRGEGVFLCGDQVAADGLLAEVTWASAVEAGRLAAGAAQRAATRRPTPS